MCVHDFLSKLDKVKQTAPNRWIACCPAHDDRHPSLSIRVTEDGRVLTHCFAGCEFPDVISAVGIVSSDLYPNNGAHHKRGERQPFNPKDILEIMVLEALIALLAARKLMAGERLSDEDMKRLQEAYNRLSEAAEIARGHY